MDPTLTAIIKIKDEATAQLKEIEGESVNLGSVLGALAGAAVAVGVAWATWDALDGAIEKTDALAESVHHLMLETGLAAEGASHVLAFGDMAGVTAGTIETSFSRLGKNLETFQAGQEKASEAVGTAHSHMADQVAQAQQHMADATEDAERKMQDATEKSQDAIEAAMQSASDKIIDAHQRMSDAVQKAGEEMSRATRDYAEAIEAANHKAANSARDTARAISDAQRDYATAQRQSAKDVRDASEQMQTAQRELQQAQADYASGHTKNNDRIISAQERVRDASERLTDLQAENADRMSRASEKVQVAQEKSAESEYQTTQSRQKIQETYGDKFQTIQETVAKTMRDSQQTIERTTRDLSENIAKIQGDLARTTEEVQTTLDRAQRNGAESMSRAQESYGGAVRKSQVDTAAFGRALKDLGLNADDLTDSAGRLTENGVKKIADAFQKLGPSEKTTADAQALFGKGAKELIPMLMLGADGYEKAAEMSDKYGRTLSDEELQKIHAYTLAHREFEMAMDGLQIEIATLVMPVLTRLLAFFSSQQPAIRAFAHEIPQYLGEAVDFFKNDFEPEVDHLKDRYSGALKLGQDATREFFDFLKTQFDLAKGIFKIVLDIVNGDWPKAWSDFKDLAKTAVSDAWTIVKDEFEKWKDLVTILAKLGADAAKALFDAIKDAAANAPTWATDLLDELAKQLPVILDWFKDLGSKAVEKIGDGIKDNAPSLGDIVHGVLNSIPGVGAATDLLGGAIHIPHFASGGFASGPTLAVVGDSPGGEFMVPASQMGAGGGIHIHFDGPVYGFPDFEQAVGSAVRNVAQGGGFRNVLARA